MTELLTMIFMLSTAIVMLLVYLRLRDMDYNATTNVKLIRRDIVDHDSHINVAVSDCALQVSNMEKNLTTEIACLATKNNEDIKRAKEGFQAGDVIEYGGEETLVLDRLNAGEEVTDYTVWSITLGVQQMSASHLEHNAKFLRRASL